MNDSDPLDAQEEPDKAFQAEAAALIGPFLKFYNLQLDAQALVENVPEKQEDSYTDYLSRVLEALDFEAQHKHVKNLKLSSVTAPVFLVSPDGRRALYLPFIENVEQNYKIFSSDPEFQNLLKNGKFTGQIISVQSQNEQGGSHTAHMKRGHALDWFWMPIVNYWRSYKEILIVSVFINMLALAIPIYSLNVYDRVIITFSQETLTVLTIGIFIALLFDFMFKTMRTYILDQLAERLGNNYDFQLMDRLMKLKNSSEDLSIGEQANMFRELQGIREFYASRLVPTLVDFPFIAMFIFVIYLLAPPIALIPILITTIILTGNFLIHIPMSRMMKKYFSAVQRKSSFLIETLAGMPTLKMFNASANRLFYWNDALVKAGRVTRKNNFLVSVMSNISYTLSQVSHVTIIVWGVYRIEDGLLTIGGLITCTILSARALAPVMSLSTLMSRLKQSQDVLKAIDVFFTMPYTGPENIRLSTKGPFKGRLLLKEVSYQYTGQERAALANVNLDIESGQNVGIIGKTAAGKTTLAKIMAGLIEPAQGEVMLDNYYYAAISKAELHSNIAYAPQDSFFFKGSVLYNIKLGRDNVDHDLLEKAIHISGLEMVLKQNGQGLDMEVGEQGHRLSGGQKQAISLARALLKDPKVLIFDEPTTGMDSMLEQHVHAQLKDCVKDKTFIMITHRTTLLSLVDRLILVDNGRVLAEGPRDDILKKLAKN